jgi:hypothetical protein
MKSKRKVLAIGIDGVIRDIYAQFDTWYRKTYIINESIVQMDSNFNYLESEEMNEEEMNDLQRQIDEKINLPLDTFDLLNHYHFENREELENFMYRDFSFQIFASSTSFPKTMDSANFLQIFGDTNDLFDVVLFAKCKDTSISSTYHFLAKFASKIRNVKFVNEYEEIWDVADVVITDCPEVIESKPEKGKTIKINHMYNTYSEADFSFDSLNDIKSEKFIKNIFE